MPVFCKLRAIFLTFPFRDARFAVCQCSGVAAYFKETSREGYRRFRKDRVGRQVGELVHRGKGASGAQSFTLGQLMNPWRVWVRTRERTSAADVKAGVLLPDHPIKKRQTKPSSGTVSQGLFCSWGTLWYRAFFSSWGGGLRREPGPRRR